jgi:hypothetical protein
VAGGERRREGWREKLEIEHARLLRYVKKKTPMCFLCQRMYKLRA